jgi:Spy/CpxP family protein refolding chaperone
MKEIMGRFRADTHDLKYDIRIKELEVRSLFTEPKTDDATLLVKEKELNNLKLKFMDRKAEMKVEWRKVLTPEQIRMLDHGHRHHGHHHHWRHHHWPPPGTDGQRIAAETGGRDGALNPMGYRRS